MSRFVDTRPTPRGPLPARRPLAAVLALAPLLVLVASPAAAEALAAPLGIPLSIPLPGPLPPVRVLTLLVSVHLVGLCFGLGGATMLDFWILRWMRWGSLPAEIARIFLFVSKVCTVGIVLLWLSGLGFLAIYALESPDKLSNPKLWAKITVVIVLTLNGLLIHASVLPGVLRDVGRPMLEGISGRRTGVFLISGAVSGVSWYTAFALGLVREFNNAVGYWVLIGLWVAAVVAATFGAYTLWLHLREWSARRQVAAIVPEAGAPDTLIPRPVRHPSAARVPASQFVRVGAAGPARA